MSFPRTALAGLCALALLSGCPKATGGGGAGGGSGNTGGGGGGAAVTEVCSNGIDDDGDGFADCADQDCFKATNCFVSCVDLCTENSSICDGAGVRQCAIKSNGCREYGDVTACSGGLLCSGGTCLSSCSNHCTLGAKACSGN
jgi:hypothetical protein